MKGGDNTRTESGEFRVCLDKGEDRHVIDGGDEGDEGADRLALRGTFRRVYTCSVGNQERFRVLYGSSSACRLPGGRIQTRQPKGRKPARLTCRSS